MLKYYTWGLVFLSFVLLVNTSGQTQNGFRIISKHTLDLSVRVGSSFPYFEPKQDRWRALFYPSWGMTIAYSSRLHRNLIVHGGIGFTGYALINKGTVDNYILDFISPTAELGMSFDLKQSKEQHVFFRFSGGVQMGYEDSFIDEFEEYTVRGESTDPVYFYTRPEVGIRRFSANKFKGSRFKSAFEIGIFYRHNFNRLGTAIISEQGFDTILRPRGSIAGAYFKMMLPIGNQRFRIEEKQEFTIPIIFHPRY